MRTHDQQVTSEPATTEEREPASASKEVAVAEGEPAAQAETVPPAAEVQESDDELLFAADSSSLRSRWDDIQATFVDDPAGCVEKADGLVEEVIEQLASGFADARAHLEAQWARGETASTEDLRLALTRYREFFQRLLAISAC